MQRSWHICWGCGYLPSIKLRSYTQWPHTWLDVFGHTFGRAWTCLDVFGRVWTCWNPVGRVWTWLSVIAGMIYCMASDREKPCRLASSTRHITKKHRKTPGRSRIYSDQKTHIYCVLNIIDPQNNIVLFLLLKRDSIKSKNRTMLFWGSIMFSTQ